MNWTHEDYGKCPVCGESYYDVKTVSVVTAEEDVDGITKGMVVMCVDCFKVSDKETIESYCKKIAEYWSTLNDWEPPWSEMQETVRRSIKEQKI